MRACAPSLGDRAARAPVASPASDRSSSAATVGRALRLAPRRRPTGPEPDSVTPTRAVRRVVAQRAEQRRVRSAVRLVQAVVERAREQLGVAGGDRRRRAAPRGAAVAAASSCADGRRAGRCATRAVFVRVAGRRRSARAAGRRRSARRAAARRSRPGQADAAEQRGGEVVGVALERRAERRAARRARARGPAAAAPATSPSGDRGRARAEPALERDAVDEAEAVAARPARTSANARSARCAVVARQLVGALALDLDDELAVGAPRRRARSRGRARRRRSRSPGRGSRSTRARRRGSSLERLEHRVERRLDTARSSPVDRAVSFRPWPVRIADGRPGPRSSPSLRERRDARRPTPARRRRPPRSRAAPGGARSRPRRASTTSTPARRRRARRPRRRARARRSGSPTPRWSRARPPGRRRCRGARARLGEARRRRRTRSRRRRTAARPRRAPRRAARRSRTTTVFCPSMRSGLSELTSTNPVALAELAAEPRARRRRCRGPRAARAPAARACARFAVAVAPGGRQHDRLEARARRVRGGRRGRVAGRRADDRARARLDRRRDGDDHAAVLEAAGRVRALALEVQLDARARSDSRARVHERRRALAERQGRSERGHAHPSSATPRSETTGQRQRAAVHLGELAERAERLGERAHARLVRDDVQRGAVAVRMLQRGARSRCRARRARRRRARARPGGPRRAGGSRTASGCRPAGSFGSWRHAASFCRKPVPIVPITLAMSAITADAVSMPAGARALERDLADRVALQHHRVERAVDLRERMLLVDERRAGRARRPARRRAAPRRRAGSPCRARARPRRRAESISVMPEYVDVGELDARVERDRREDRHLRGRVGAGDVVGRVGLGVAALLRLGRAPRRSVLPPSISVSTKFVVPLTMPSTRWTFVTTSDSRSTLITGIAAQTLASKRSCTPAADAAAKSSAPRRATSCLFAETTCLPRRSSSST